jgi:hypothetical protein
LVSFDSIKRNSWQSVSDFQNPLSPRGPFNGDPEEFFILVIFTCTDLYWLQLAGAELQQPAGSFEREVQSAFAGAAHGN